MKIYAIVALVSSLLLCLVRLASNTSISTDCAKLNDRSYNALLSQDLLESDGRGGTCDHVSLSV